MGSPVEPGRRLRGYMLLSRILFPKSYSGKIFLLAFIGTHVPLVALIVYLVMVAGPASPPTLKVLLVALAATIVGSAGTLVGVWLLLTPVAVASSALQAYRLAGTPPHLPTNLEGGAGELLADVQHTLDHLDSFVSRLADEALRDPLTGAPNRRAFEQRLTGELTTAAERGETVALIALDVDGLKEVNDDWGHEAGDAFLRHLTAALVRHLHGHGWIARWGGDEFIAVVREGADGPEAETILAEVEAALAADPVRLPNGEQVALRASGGVARAHSGEGAQELFARADAELYRAKRATQRAHLAG